MKKQKSLEEMYFDFPYSSMPICLKHYEHDTFKTCWFSSVYHMNKYLERYKISEYAARDAWGNDLTIEQPKMKKKPKKNQNIGFSSLDDFFV